MISRCITHVRAAKMVNFADEIMWHKTLIMSHFIIFQGIFFLMRPAWLRSLLVGSVRSDSSEKRFGRKLVFTSSSSIITIIITLIIIIILNWTTWTLGLVESDPNALSTMVSATLAILDFSSAEEPWRKKLGIKIYQEKEGADLRGPCENWFLVHVQQNECVLVVQAGHLFGHWVMVVELVMN